MVDWGPKIALNKAQVRNVTMTSPKRNNSNGVVRYNAARSNDTADTKKRGRIGTLRLRDLMIREMLSDDNSNIIANTIETNVPQESIFEPKTNPKERMIEALHIAVKPCSWGN